MTSNASLPENMQDENKLIIIPDKPYVYTLAYSNGIVFYVGKGTNGRIHRHEYEASHEKDPSYNLRKSNVIRKIWKEGEDMQKRIISYFDSEREAHEYEVALIFFMKPYGKLANITDGGEGVSGYKTSDDTKKLISAIHKGRKVSNETRQKLSKANKGSVLSEESRKRMKLAHLNNPPSEETILKIVTANKSRTGYKHTDESKQKMSEAQSGRVCAEEVKQKISNALKGKTVSNKTKVNMSKGQKGHIVSEETKQKISNANKGKKRTDEMKNRISEARQKNPTWLGKSHTEETKQKMSDARKAYLARKKEGLA